jgi:tetratricopeptide (TPR) repeat protein
LWRAAFAGYEGAVWLRAVLIACALTLAPAAWGQEGDPRDLQARKLFAAGDYSHARDLYAELYAETLHPTYLRNIGRCFQNMGEPDKAISSFREYLRQSKNLEPDKRREIEGYISEMEDQKRRRESAARPSELPLNPRPAPDSALAPPPEVRAGAEDSEGGVLTRWWFWTGLGALLAGGAAGAYLLSRPGTPTADTSLGTMRSRL